MALAARTYLSYDASTPLFGVGNPNDTLYIDYSSQNLRKEVVRRQSIGQQIKDEEALGVFGLLLGLGSFMEQGLEFHQSVCLQNILVINGQLQVSNPYLQDIHVQTVVKDFIRPILALGTDWKKDFFVDDRQRDLAG